ncbi:hypothetical protein BSK62_16950 [Paenibacillus odorifer]|nr:hypothetical protein BSK62_16950 [Paenibacillus odorifer]
MNCEMNVSMEPWAYAQNKLLLVLTITLKEQLKWEIVISNTKMVDPLYAGKHHLNKYVSIPQHYLT